MITSNLQQRLWAYLGGIAREHKITAVEVGGVADHVHMLLLTPPTIAISKAMQLVKGGSSKWVHDTFREHADFAWQTKYGAFSVSQSRVEGIVDYIRKQPEHHQKMSFKEEFLQLLKKHRILYDERYLWE